MAIDDQPMNVYWSGKRTETVNRSKINYKGSVTAFSDLPDIDNQKGDMYSVTDLNGENYIWNGMAWDNLGTSDANVVHKTGNETIGGVKAFTDDIVLTDDLNIRRSNNTGIIRLCGGVGASYTTGAKFYAYGASSSTNAGCFYAATGGTAGKQFCGKPDGTFTWDGNAIQISSDARLKTKLSLVPEAVLDAWGNVNWGEFKFLDAVKKKGDNARFHVGLIAQDVRKAFTDQNLDICCYGILCHEDYSGKDSEFELEDLWMVRYTEALCMEAAYQRKRADKAEARIKALEERLEALEARFG